jgi:hypothetical protein
LPVRRPRPCPAGSRARNKAAKLSQQRGDTLKALTTFGDVLRELAAEQAAAQ